MLLKLLETTQELDLKPEHATDPTATYNNRIIYIVRISFLMRLEFPQV
jgi:hypothetical protein